MLDVVLTIVVLAVIILFFLMMIAVRVKILTRKWLHQNDDAAELYRDLFR